MPTVFSEDPYAAFNFIVTINGILDDGLAVRCGFKECSGLSAETEVILYRNGSEKTAFRKIPGLQTYSNIILKRGWTGDISLWNWRLDVINGQVKRSDGSIVMLDANRQEVTRFNFIRGWPVRWEGPSFDSTKNEIAIETLEIAHEGLAIDGQA